jgi:hypothetical protein
MLYSVRFFTWKLTSQIVSQTWKEGKTSEVSSKRGNTFKLKAFERTNSDYYLSKRAAELKKIINFLNSKNN